MDESNISVNKGSDRVTVGDSIAAVAAKKESKETADFVRRQAYEEVSQDMHKYKAKARDVEAKAAELEAKLKALEEDKLKEEKRYQELYEREKKQREQEAANRMKDRALYLRGLKLSQLKAELGNIREEYLSHAAIDEIEVKEDGSISSDSLRSVANKFRQEHPLLMPQSASSNITNHASPMSFNPTSNRPKSLHEMSFDEKAAYIKQLKNNK